MAYTLNPVLLHPAPAGGPATLLRPAGAVFGANLTHAVLSVWLSDPLYASGATHHAFGIEFDDANVSPATWWQFSVGTDNLNTVGIGVVRQSTAGTQTAFTWGSQIATWPACQTNVLVSMDFLAGTVQAYINDVAQPFSSGTPPQSWFNAGIPFGSAVTVSEQIVAGGYMSDLWFGATPSFVDLTVVANRRKFINADLTPVDLGPTGAGPFGTSPTLFQTIPAGGVATDFLTNRGTAGGLFAPDTGNTIEAVGDPCSDGPGPTPPGPPPAPSENTVWLDWSDSRGHAWSNPLSQSLGGTGHYNTNLQWNRLGFARDRVFRVTWTSGVRTVLQGAWLELTPGGA